MSYSVLVFVKEKRNEKKKKKKKKFSQRCHTQTYDT